MTKSFNNAINYALFHTACDMLNTIEAVDPKKKAIKDKVKGIIKKIILELQVYKLGKD